MVGVRWLWTYFSILARLSLAGSLLLLAIYPWRPDVNRWHAFAVALSVAAGLCEAVKLGVREVGRG